MTIKTRSQLLTVDFVANAGTEAIGSQNFRNFVDSAMGCYAQLDTNTAAGLITKSLTTTFSALTGFTNSTPAASELTASTTNGTITIPADSGTSGYGGIYLVSYHVQIQTASETPLLEASVHKGGTQQVATYTAVDVTVGAKRYAVSNVCLLSLAAGDVLDLRVKCGAGSTTNSAFIATFMVKRVA